MNYVLKTYAQLKCYVIFVAEAMLAPLGSYVEWNRMYSQSVLVWVKNASKKKPEGIWKRCFLGAKALVQVHQCCECTSRKCEETIHGMMFPFRIQSRKAPRERHPTTFVDAVILPSFGAARIRIRRLRQQLVPILSCSLPISTAPSSFSHDVAAR